MSAISTNPQQASGTDRARLQTGRRAPRLEFRYAFFCSPTSWVCLSKSWHENCPPTLAEASVCSRGHALQHATGLDASWSDPSRHLELGSRWTENAQLTRVSSKTMSDCPEPASLTCGRLAFGCCGTISCWHHLCRTTNAKTSSQVIIFAL